jgi:phosphotriesterase-related protein
MHEHVKFVTHELAHDYPELSWDPPREVVLDNAVRALRDVRDAGVSTIVDCTAFWHGRDVDFMREVNEQVDVHIVAATGIYAFDHLPYFVTYRPVESDDEVDILVRMFMRDIEIGIADSGVRAQIIKVGTDVEGITPNNERVLRAAARAHRETGVPITTHTQAALRNGLDQQRVFAAEGVDLGRVVIGHCGDTTDLGYLRALMDAGSVIGSDRFGLYLEGRATLEERVDVIAQLCEQGYAQQIVVSHDKVLHNDLTDPRKPRPSQKYAMTHVPLDVVPLLRERGVSERDIAAITVDTPRRILEPRED